MQIPVSDQSRAQLTPRVEHHFVERVTVRSELNHQGIKRDLVEGDRDEDLALAGSQFGVDGTAQGGEQIPPLRFLRGVETEPVRQSVDGVPLDALAAELGSSRNALYKTMFDARRKLRASLVANGYLHENPVRHP